MSEKIKDRLEQFALGYFAAKGWTPFEETDEDIWESATAEIFGEEYVVNFETHPETREINATCRYEKTAYWLV